MPTSSGGPPPEATSGLAFPVRPRGEGEVVKQSRRYWYDLAAEIHGAFADLTRAIDAMQWSGDGRKAFDAVWSQLSGHGAEASQHAQDMGDHLFRIGDQIRDAQHEWEVAMTAMTASAAIGIGLTVVTFGMSDAVAESTATAAVGTMEAVCIALDASLDAALQVLMAAVRVAAQLVVKFTWQFGISMVSQETSNAVQGRSLSNLDLLQGIAVSMLVPEGRELVGPVAGLSRVGSALKRDLPKNVVRTARVETESEFTQVPVAHGFPDIVDNYAGFGSEFTLPDGVVLYQVQGSLAGVAGRFEWIMDGGMVTHRMFVKGGLINGKPIVP